MRRIYIYLVILLTFAGGLFLFLPKGSNAAETGVTVRFDVLPGVSPKILPYDRKLPVTLEVTIDLAKFGAYCGDSSVSSFNWGVKDDVSGAIPDEQVGSTKTVAFARDQAVVTKKINDTVQVQHNRGTTLNNPGTYYFYAFIECPNDDTASESSRVQVIGGNSNDEFNYTCVVPDASKGGYAYSCSPANLSNCSDNPQCGGKQCFKITKSLCGHQAPPGGDLGGPGADPGGAGSDTGVPGEPVPYTFSITNPLGSSGATTVGDLANIIANFIFQLAIPIAVIMILYGGFLFLTSGGNEARITQARKVLTYAVVGLAIVFIGSGFVDLIKDILKGNYQSTTTTDTNTDTGANTDSGTGKAQIGEACASSFDCDNALTCNNGICEDEISSAISSLCSYVNTSGRTVCLNGTASALNCANVCPSGSVSCKKVFVSSCDIRQ